MAKAYPETQPGAQSDVPRTDEAGNRPDQLAPDHSEEGPVHGALAKAVNELRNAASAIGPVNYLPDTWPADEVAALRRATEIVLRLVDANNAIPAGGVGKVV